MYELCGKCTHGHSSPNCGNVITTYLTSNLQTDGRDGKRAEHPNEAGHYYVISFYRAKQEKQNEKTSERLQEEVCVFTRNLPRINLMMTKSSYLQKKEMTSSKSDISSATIFGI